MGKMHAGAIGGSFNFISNFRVKVKGGLAAGEQVRIRVNPEELRYAKELFEPSTLDKAIEKVGGAVLFSSVVTTAFQGVGTAGLFVGKGVGGATAELLERSLPVSPARVLDFANMIRKKVDCNSTPSSRSKPDSDSDSDSDSEVLDSEPGSWFGADFWFWTLQCLGLK